jgi:CheY-like chemotaxis protein
MTAPAVAHARPTILIVEDEALIREVNAMEFEDAGFDVLTAGDGETALSLLVAHPEIDLLFTDISLYDSIDGWTIARRARAMRPQLPVIYATGYSPEAPQLVEGGRFFKKPFLPAAIIAAAREMIAA